MEKESSWEVVSYLYCLAFVLVMVKVYNILSKGKCRSKKRLDGKVIIVTGANTGMGKITALDLAKRGAKVILACMDRNEAEEAKDDIVKISGNKNIVCRHLDLSSLTSVRNFAKKIIATENRLDILINNAGIAGLVNKKTEDAIEWGYQVNHYGHFLLTILLIDLLKKSAPSRIVHVCSLLHRFGHLDFDNMNCEKGICNLISSSNSVLSHSVDTFVVYSNSKLYNLIGSSEFARRLKGTGVTSNCVHPGLVGTTIYNNIHPFFRFIILNIARIFCKTTEEGAQTAIYLAVSDEVTGVSGKYFVDCKEASASSIAQNIEIGRRFWEKCCDIVALKPEERLI